MLALTYQTKALPFPYTDVSRQQWLSRASDALRAKFAECGFKLPHNIRISIGFPKGARGAKSHAIGQCWSTEASSDKHSEIFISPEICGRRGGPRILDTLAHEFAHVVAGVAAKHGKDFKRVAVGVGLTGQMTATVGTEEFYKWCEGVLAAIGDFPAGSLHEGQRKKQPTLLLKVECPICGYLARVTGKWIKQAGAPICPADNVQLACDAIPEGEEGE